MAKKLKRRKRSRVHILDSLFQIIRARRRAKHKSSYTAKLFGRGKEKIAAKLGEESVETVIAGVHESRARVASESADLLYHLLVLWAVRGVKPAAVWAELRDRKGVSGLKEKASRGKRGKRGGQARSRKSGKR